jgi:bacterioferritin
LTDIKTIRERARQHIEQGAVTPEYRADRQTVLQVLNEALATELVCTLRYKRHYFSAKGIDARIVAEEFEEHAADDREHADKIAARIVQLGGAPDFSPQGLAARSYSQYVPGSSLLEMIREDLVAERIGVERYREIVVYLGNDDPTTRRLMEEILATKERHADELAAMLRELGEQHVEELIDEAIEETFPASDTPAPAVEEVFHEK